MVPDEGGPSSLHRLLVDPLRRLWFLSQGKGAEGDAAAAPDVAVVSKRGSTNGWHRLKTLYSDGDVHFETGITKTCMQWAFIGAVLLRAPLSSLKAAERYSRYAKGRVFLSPRDALRRRWDYAFASFLRTGAINGSLAAIYVGCVVAAITHTAAWRGHFSLWTLPLVTTAVPSFIALPFGLFGVAQAASLGLTCGLTLATIVYGASAYSNRTVNEVYESLKQECETELRKEREQDRTISIYQKEHKIWFRGLAKYQMQKEKRDMDAKLANTPNTEHSS